MHYLPPSVVALANRRPAEVRYTSEGDQWLVNTGSVKNATILIVDDQQLNIQVIARFLAREGYTNLHSTTHPDDVLDLYRELEPDLILLDLLMPILDGFDVMAQLQQQIPAGVYLPILVLTGDDNIETRRRALALGAKDFLTKPFDHTELLLRVHNLLETRLLYCKLEQQKAVLEDRVWDRTQALERAQLEILRRLARAAEYRDDDTGQHTLRVGRTAGLVARELGLTETTIDLIRQAAQLHDVGKIGVPDTILLKPGALTDEEFDRVKLHTSIGAAILSGSDFPLLQLAEEIALAHHERWDGTGYPRRLCADQAPLAARIVAVADTFDALTHVRPYKRAWPITEALEEIKRQRGRQFDPEIVEAFMRIQAARTTPRS